MRRPTRRLALLLVASALLATSMELAAAQDMTYACIPGIPGESLEASHTNWIEAFGLDHGASNNASPGAPGGPGAANLTNVSVLKGTDLATPLLHEALSAGNLLGDIVIDVCRTGAGPQPECYYTLVLQGTYIQAIDLAGSSCIDPATSCTPAQTESVTFTYTKISWTYTEFSNGKQGQTICKCWDAQGGASCSCPSTTCTP